MNLSIGQSIGQWTILEEHPKDKWGNRRYSCKCSCGSVRKVRQNDLKNGNSSSCGCVQRRRDDTRNRVNSSRAIKIDNKRLVYQIRYCAQQSQVSPKQWVQELLTDWIREHRSNRDPIPSLENIMDSEGDEVYNIGYYNEGDE